MTKRQPEHRNGAGLSLMGEHARDHPDIGPAPVPWWRDEKKVLQAADKIRSRREDRRRKWSPVMESLLLQGFDYFRAKLRKARGRVTDEMIAAEILRDRLFEKMNISQVVRKHQRLIKEQHPKK